MTTFFGWLAHCMHVSLENAVGIALWIILFLVVGAASEYYHNWREDR